MEGQKSLHSVQTVNGDESIVKHDKTQLTNETPNTKVESNHARRWRKTYGALGFNKGYNLPLCMLIIWCSVELQWLTSEEGSFLVEQCSVSP